MSKQKFSRAFKRAVCIEYMQSGKHRNEIAIKYGLPSPNTISCWMQYCLSPLEIKEKCVNLPPVIEPIIAEMVDKTPKDMAQQASQIEALEKKIKALEAKLKRSEDKNLALNVLIDIAEEQGIRIRKKSGVKQ